MRVAIVWPRPRKPRWRKGQTAPDEFPDFSDALLFLEEQGIDVAIEESLGLPLNPLIRSHEFYSGLDPLRALRVAARARKYDAIICIGDATALVLVWLRERGLIRTPIILIDPALSTDYPRRRRLQDYVLPRVQHVMVFGRIQLDYLAREYGDRVNATFMYHRADTAFYQPPHPRVPAHPAVVLGVGNDISRDFDTLAAAASIIRDGGDRTTRFVVQTTRAVADPGQVLDIRRDPVSYPALRQLYAEASVVALPLHETIHAGGINTLLEALSMACPIVISSSRGLGDYVRDGETARVVPVGDAKALAAAITDLLASPETAARLGENARQFAVGQCDNRVYAAKLAGVIRNVTRPM